MSWTTGLQFPAGEMMDFFFAAASKTNSEAHDASYPVGTGDSLPRG